MNKKVVLFLSVLLLATGLASALEVEFFYGQGCPHCAAAAAWFDDHAEKYNLSIVKYEVYHNKSNALLMQERLAALGEKVQGVPTFILNQTVLVGWDSRVAATIVAFSNQSFPQSLAVTEPLVVDGPPSKVPFFIGVVALFGVMFIVYLRRRGVRS